MSTKKDGAVMVGVGAAACVACCAGPILGFLGAIGLGTITGVLLFGVAGLIIAVIGIAVFTPRRQRRRTVCVPAPEVVAVEMPTTKNR